MMTLKYIFMNLIISHLIGILVYCFIVQDLLIAITIGIVSHIMNVLIDLIPVKE
ncbi:hypothetical protein [Mammaliicoccus sp. G-M28]|uniref:hypothetical protein n=1 Tax=Mammaliicoccus sp. G-M28 TaxID=2898688 RepID=UPI001EFB9200|nr:hypothetical protein [Mammaliicoccus sp. G-M28]